MGTGFMIADVAATLYICFFLRYISNDANTIIWIGMSLNVLAVLLGLLIVESPSWYVS